ncbi:MAG TPA: L-histidine N(alpha)-methyltransferase [Bryobacteraceae bacterium]|jgi:L-histidine N-alpha-methyltransferase|nr:L-histidine N(alpha)-methyltransferase [Bryobacteraceae bacterium]
MPITAESYCPSEVLSEFAADVSTGLSKSQKELPAKYLYDEVGSALFEAITALPEYGLTRAEERLLGRHASEIARWLPCNVAVAELGSGSGRKTRPVLEAIASPRDSVSYCAIDISRAALGLCCNQLNGVSGVEVRGLLCPYLEGLAEICSRRHGDDCLLVLFLGSSIGNFERDQAVRFLTAVRKRLRPGDALLLGTDLGKCPSQLLAAYDDPTGVTAAFNLNLLGRINRELSGNFNLRNFRHAVRWRSGENRIEMHLRSQTRQVVEIPGASFQVEFEAGETIWTESSHKFDADELQLLAGQTGFISVARWIDTEWPFLESLWIA